jgi:hypothetical protein
LARNAYTTADTQERRGYALIIEAVATEEKGDTATAATVHPRLVEVDPGIGSTDKAHSAALSGVLKVQQVRRITGARRPVSESRGSARATFLSCRLGRLSAADESYVLRV